MNKPSLFIGSSSEGLDVAREVELLLQDVAEVSIWSDKGIKIPSDLSGIHTAPFHGNRVDGNLTSALSPACTVIRKAIKSLGVLPSRNAEQLQQATAQVQNVSISMEQLIELLARSRLLELDITANMFGSLLPQSQLQQMRKDIESFQMSLKAKQANQDK